MSARQSEEIPGTIRPREAHRFDEARLESYLRAKVAGFAGPLDILQFAGGQSNPTFVLDTPARRYVLRKKPPGTLLPSAHAVDREYRVMWLLASGRQINQIAAEMYLSPSTVSTYRARILKKLRLTDNAALVRYAVKYQLI